MTGSRREMYPGGGQGTFRRYHRNCKRCGGHFTEVGEIAKRGLCGDCSKTAVESNVEQLHNHAGPNWQRYRESMIRAFGGIVPDRESSS